MRRLTSFMSLKWSASLLVLLGLLTVGGLLCKPAFAAETAGKPVEMKAAEAHTPAASHGSVHWFEPFTSDKFDAMEKTGLIIVLLIAIIGLAYALMLMKQVLAADQGTKKMQGIADAVREGANAYLGAQFRKIGPLIVVITILLYFTKYQTPAFAVGRAGAFLMGALFSWAVGFVGDRGQPARRRRCPQQLRRSHATRLPHGYRRGHAH